MAQPTATKVDDESNIVATSDSSPEECFEKLRKIKNIRQKTIQFEKLKLFLEELLKDSEEEKQLLEKFRTEINLLLQEKMAHVEELRLIHTDINTMENLIKNRMMDRNKTLNEMKKQLDKYKPLKFELDAMLQDIGLPASNGLNLEQFEQASKETNREKEASCSSVEKPGLSNVFVLNETKDKLHLGLNDGACSSSHPPPMKLCGSCHQYIHRNAPICPLCKAKSRSRNPKKQKKMTKIVVN